MHWNDSLLWLISKGSGGERKRVHAYTQLRQKQRSGHRHKRCCKYEETIEKHVFLWKKGFLSFLFVCLQTHTEKISNFSCTFVSKANTDTVGQLFCPWKFSKTFICKHWFHGETSYLDVTATPAPPGDGRRES